MFDKNYKFLDAAYDQIAATAQQVGVSPVVAHDYMTKEYTVKEEGYVFMYIANENQTQVDAYFDDVAMTYTPTSVVQYNEYYPFGLQASTSWTRESNSNNYLYNAGNELNSKTGWYETFFRGYDPTLGRFLQVDPMATSYASHSSYNYGFNNPIYFNDPNGADAKPTDNDGISDIALARMAKIYEATGWSADGEAVAMGQAILNIQAYERQLLSSARSGDEASVYNYARWFGRTYELTIIDYYNGIVDDDNYIDTEYRLSQTQNGPGDGLDWAAGGRALVRSLVPFGNDIYPESEEDGYDPNRKIIAATVPDLPIGPSGGVKGAKASYTVYKAIAKNGNVYWGMTKNFAQRVAQHGNRFVSITEEYVNIGSKGAARGLEQMRIDAAGGIRNLENAINSIGPNNPKLMQYYQDAIRYLNGL